MKSEYQNQFDISILQFTTYSTGMVILFIALFVAAISIVLFIAFRMIRKQKQLEEKAMEYQFHDNCRRYQFTDAETEAITRAISHYDGQNYNDVFELQNVYELAVHEDIEQAIDNGADIAELEGVYGGIRKKLHYIILPEGIALVSTRSVSSGTMMSLVDIKCEALLVENLETCFVLKYPPDRIILLKNDSTLRLAFSRSGDGLYAMDVKVMEHGGGRIRCRHTTALKRHQNRRDVRMRLNARAKFYLRDTDNNRVYFEGKLLDLSAGGFCFETSIDIKEKTEIGIASCSLPLPLIGLKSVVITSTMREKDKEVIYKCHAAFNDIPFEKKEKIVTYLFVKMRELQKK